MLRRAGAWMTLVLAVVTAGLLDPPVWALDAANSTEAPSAAHHGKPTSSLSLVLRAQQGQLRAKGKPTEVLPIQAKTSSVLLVSLQPLAILGSTDASSAPRFTLSLPAGVELQRVTSDLDSGVTGTWSCHGTTGTVNCSLNGRIANGMNAQAVVVVRGTDTTKKAGTRLGDVTVSASARVTDPQRHAQVVTASSSIPALAVARMRPAFVMRSVEMPRQGARNVARIRVIPLAAPDANKPQVRLATIVPRGARDVVVSAKGWKCSRGNQPVCTSTGTPVVGQPMEITASFVAPATDAEVMWRVDGQFTGIKGRQTSFGLYVRQPRAVMDKPSFRARLLSEHGQDISSGHSLPVVLAVTNLAEDAYAPTVTISLPAGVSATESDRNWTCKGTSTLTCTGPTLAAHATARVPLRLAAAADVTTGMAVVKVAAAPGQKRTSVHAFHLVDSGDPVAGVSLRQVTPGGTATLDDGRTMDAKVSLRNTFRAIVTNVGGDDLRPGQKVTVTQSAGDDVTFVAVTTNRGSCTLTGKGTGWSCTLSRTAGVAPRDVIGSIDVTFTPTATSAAVALRRITSRVAGEIGGPLYRSIAVQASQPELPLGVVMLNHGGVTPGGSGTMSLRVRNRSGSQSVTGVQVTALLPSRITLAATASGKWACSMRSLRVACDYSGTVAPGRSTPTVDIPMTAASNARPQVADVVWIAEGTKPTYAEGHTRARLTVHELPVVAADAIPSVIGARRLSEADTSIVLRSTTSTTRDRRAWTTTWSQVCTTAAQRAALTQCAGASGAGLTISGAAGDIASAKVPPTRKDRKYIFAAMATDGIATITRYVTVRAAGIPHAVAPRSTRVVDARTGRAVAPAPSSPAPSTGNVVVAMPDYASASWYPWIPPVGFRVASLTRVPRTAGPSATISGGPLLTASTGDTVTLTAGVSGGSAPYTYAWSQIGGASLALSSTTSSAPTLSAPSGSSIVTYQLVVTDANSQTATTSVTIAFNPSVTTQFCNLYNQAQGAIGTISSALGGGVSAVFADITMVGNACTASAGFTFSSTTVSFGGFTISNASGTVTAAGIMLSAGSLSTPSAWGLGSLDLGDDGLLIAFVGTGAADVTLSGHFAIDSFAFLPLPGGWSGTTSVAFRDDSSSTVVSVDANASGPDSATASVTGDVASNGTFSLTASADDLVYVGGAGIDATGTVALATPSGSLSGSVTGSLSGAASLGDGVTIPALTVTWTPGGSPAVSAAGTLSIASGAQTTSLNISMAYTSKNDWSVTVTGAGNSVWEPLPGLQITPSDFSGTLGYASGTYTWDIRADVSTPWSPTSVLTIDSISVELASSCPANVSSVLTCPSADVFLGVAGDATVDAAPADSFTATADAVIAMGTGPSAGGFALAASVAGSVDIADGVSLTSATLTASYNVTQTASGPAVSGTTENGYAVGVSGSVSLASVGSFVGVQANVTSAGWSLAGYTDGIPFGSADEFGSMNNSIFAYSTMPTTITPPVGYDIGPLVYVDCSGGASAPDGEACTNSLYVSGTYAAPGWFTSAVGGAEVSATATIEIDPSTGSYSATVTPDLSGLMSIQTGGSASGLNIALGDLGGTSLTVQSVYFNLDTTAGALVVTAGGSIDLGLPSGYGDAPPTLDLFMQYDVTSNTVSGGFTLDDQAGWQNAFDDQGLTLYSMTVSLQLNLDTMTPALGLAATADLPSDLTTPFDISLSAPVSAFVDLSVDTPCMGISIGAAGSGQPTVLTIGGGALTASYVNFYVVPAPGGCVIGTTTYAQGFALDFDGTILDVGVDITSAVSFAPTTLNATIDISAFQVGPLTVQDVQLGIDFVSGVSDDITFNGAFELFGTAITAAGSFDYVDATDTTTITLDVSENQFGVSGFSIDNADINLDVTSSPGSTSIDFAGSGDMNILGDTLDINQLDFSVANNIVTSITADVSANLDLNNAIAFNGDFYVNYSASDDNLDVAADVTITTGGFTLGSGTLSITPECADVTASMNIAGLFNASLGGYVIYGDGCSVINAATGVSTPIEGGAGAFCVDASLSGITVGGFSGAGAATLSNNGDLTCDGTSTSAGDMVGSLNVDLTLGTQDVNSTVNVAGTYASNGDFSFTGSDTLDVSGFDLGMSVTASSTGGAVSVAGSGTFDLLGNSLTLAGSFAPSGGVPATTLSAGVNPLSIGGFGMGSGNVTLDEGPSGGGMSFAMDLQAGGQSAQADVTFAEVGGDVLFLVGLDIDLGIPGVASVSADGSFSDCSDSSCTSMGSVSFWVDNVSFSYGGLTYGNPTAFGISNIGDFSYSTSASGSNESTPTTNVAGVNWWTGNDSWWDSLSVSESGVSASSGGSATIYSQETALCGGSSSGGGSSWSWSLGSSSSSSSSWTMARSAHTPRSICSVVDWGTIGASISVNPWSMCIWISGINQWACL